MTEIEKMRRYIERTKLDKNKMCLVYPEAAALFRQGKDTEDGLFGAIGLAFKYGQAKGYRAEKAEGRARV